MEEREVTRKKVDEEGNELTDEDLTGFECDRVEEVFDNNGKIIGFIHHYKKIPEIVLKHREVTDCKFQLSKTDIDIIRAYESLLETLTGANTLTDLIATVKNIHDTNKEIIDKRKEWRNRIRKITKG